MKKHTEKQPIDDLFARKLGNTSLPPSPDGYERLQARLNQREPETRRVFWQSPVAYRYVAAAACLVLVCLFGLHYWSTVPKSVPDGTVAINKQVTPSKQGQSSTVDSTIIAMTTDKVTPDLSTIDQKQVAQINEAVESKERDKGSLKLTAQTSQPAFGGLPSPADKLILTPKKTENKTEVVAPISTEAAGQLAQNTSQPAPATERVLVVTIAEPAGLMAARLPVTASDIDKPLLARIDQTDQEAAKPTKMNTLWQQVKRVKQGDVFARRDAGDDERGLLNRAYTGLKQSFDKDKVAKP